MMDYKLLSIIRVDDDKIILSRNLENGSEEKLQQTLLVLYR